jgi:hypothetical protein
MNGSGKGGNNRRRPFKHRDRNGDNWQDNSSKQGKKNTENPRYDKNRGIVFERPKWAPPKMSADPLPVLECAYCGKQIKDISTAMTDKNSGSTVHFECAISRIAEGENLEKGDSISYIGGGRFGIIHFINPQDTRRFTIKKIFEWEDKENRADWRKSISEHYSVT